MAPSFPRPQGAPAPRRPYSLTSAGPQADEKARTQLPVRRFDILYLDEIGNIEDTHRLSPALPGFEASCGAFAHGTMIQTEIGPVPVEDLLPGQKIMTRDNGPQPLLWIGSMTLVPHPSDPRVEPAKLIRVIENSVGLGKPSRDLVFGPYARILRRNAACISLFGTESAFAPVSAFADGVSIIEVTPVSPVRVFHLMLHGQHVITASGMEVESYHPGRRDTIGISPSLMPNFMEMFPNISDLSGFGPMRMPRLSHDDIQSLESD